jgi:hypothetical protein
MENAALRQKIVFDPKQAAHVDVSVSGGKHGALDLLSEMGQSTLAYVSTLYLPCAVHEGEPEVLLSLIQRAKQFHCHVGALIGYPDPFHRGEVSPPDIAADKLIAWVLVQVGILKTLLSRHQLELSVVRADGALYRDFWHRPERAVILAKALASIDPWMTLVVPNSPGMSQIQQETTTRIAPERWVGVRLNANQEPQLGDWLTVEQASDQLRPLLQPGGKTETTLGEPTPLSLHLPEGHPQLEGLVSRLSTLIPQCTPLPARLVSDQGWL